MTTETEGAPEGVTEDVAAVDQVAEEAPAQDDEPSGEDAAAAPEPTAEKPRRSAQERINEAVKAQREAEREREYWREQALKTQPAPQRQEQQTEAKEPDANDYEYGTSDARYIEDRAVFRARQEFERDAARRDADHRARNALMTFEQRVGEQFPDGEPEGLTRLRGLPTLSPAVQEAIMDSDVGPKLADHLGSNTRELNRISALPPLQQARELAKLELKLATPPARTPKIATDAPAPTQQVRGSGGQFKPAPDTNDFVAFQSTYGSG
jgi:hypothetical protein